MIRSSRESATERMSLTPVGAECAANNSTSSCSYHGVPLEPASRHITTSASVIFGSRLMPANRVNSSRPSATRSEEHTSELQSLTNLVCRLLLEKKKHHYT